ncbi:hypothetical protein CUJ83_02285 [Methanocella sp. CWC-04]|uniref:Uncharacterized protein n=1 Tax=Methanooceanicella nereidis TaxID=2052831 RepID=A0AAP2RC33_9EURY|nr:hypothetical protein [Methanocella sp. CWC-04]MCD1293825.1 hypothetical protein [Methanocella sp. CWC-04]
MEDQMEMALFVVSMVWFIFLTGIFLVYVKTRLQRDEIDEIKKVNEESHVKIGRLYRSFNSIKRVR